MALLALWSKTWFDFNRFFLEFKQTVNIPNAYEDSRFDPSVDEGQLFQHKSILCMAIKNSLGQIIGVIQLINKFDDLVSKNSLNFQFKI